MVQKAITKLKHFHRPWKSQMSKEVMFFLTVTVTHTKYFGDDDSPIPMYT